jgi:hypothetical protein
MNATVGSPESLLQLIVLGTLAIGLPIVFVLLIRFLWDRQMNLGRSKELEKLIWQLHRIASAMEHQMNLSYPAVQPGTEEAQDLAYLKQIPTQQAAAGAASARGQVNARPQQQPLVGPAAFPPVQAVHPVHPELPVVQPAVPVAPQTAVQAAPQTAEAQAAAPAEEHNPGLVLRDPAVEAPRAGVNSMFGL